MRPVPASNPKLFRVLHQMASGDDVLSFSARWEASDPSTAAKILQVLSAGDSLPMSTAIFD